MKRSSLLLFLLFGLSVGSYGQLPPHEITLLKKKLASASSDSIRINLLIDLSNAYRFSNIDSALSFAEDAMEQSRQTAQPALEGYALSQKGYILLETGEIPESLQDQFASLGIAQKSNDLYLEAWCLNRIGNTYMELSDYPKAIANYNASKNLFIKYNKEGYVYNVISNIANVYEMMGELDSSKIYQQQVYRYSLTNTDRYAITYGEMRERLGNVERRLGNYDSAIIHYKKGIEESLKDFDYRNLAANYLQLTRVFYFQKHYDSAFHYAKRTIDVAETVSWKKAIYEASGLLTAMYNSVNQPDSAVHYALMNMEVRDALYGPEKIRQLQRITLREQERELQLKRETEQLQTRYRMIALLSALAVFFILAIILWQNNRKKQIINRRLSEQKDQISAQRNELEVTLNELKTTQSLLIQSEKMASLGELTAGIAHEIQNPLNFVNNFSEVNKELLSEMSEEMEKGNLEEAKSLAKNVIDNQERINQHGKRADGIVKSMLQHSRTSSGTAEPTNINALTDEYLKLAYHGLRAKDKSFNVTLKTSYDESIALVNVVQQDIGRVILNLLNNAFYAVHEKAKHMKGKFEPLVSVSTKHSGENILISIKDNGIGISPKVIDKIFQPFFTTKATGQGTGLGLSLSYDIVKAHSGKLSVETMEGEGAEFTISLPAKTA